MIHRYFPHTPEDIAAMLAKCGMESLDDLYADVPESLRLKRDYDVPSAMSEEQVRACFPGARESQSSAHMFCRAGLL